MDPWLGHVSPSILSHGRGRLLSLCSRALVPSNFAQVPPSTPLIGPSRVNPCPEQEKRGAENGRRAGEGPPEDAPRVERP